MDLLLSAPLSAGWTPWGESAKVWLAGGNERRVVLGAMNLLTGTRLLLPRPKRRPSPRSVGYRGWHAALLLDEDLSHMAKGIVEPIGRDTLLWLLKRSPELNPMDTLWCQPKDVISNDKQYGTIDDHVTCFLAHLNGLSGREALQTSGVLSGNFWWRHVLSKKFCNSA